MAVNGFCGNLLRTQKMTNFFSILRALGGITHPVMCPDIFQRNGNFGVSPPPFFSSGNAEKLLLLFFIF